MASQRRIARVRAGVNAVLTLLVIIAISAAIIAFNSAIEALPKTSGKDPYFIDKNPLIGV